MSEARSVDRGSGLALARRGLGTSLMMPAPAAFGAKQAPGAGPGCDESGKRPGRKGVHL